MLTSDSGTSLPNTIPYRTMGIRYGQPRYALRHSLASRWGLKMESRVAGLRALARRCRRIRATGNRSGASNVEWVNRLHTKGFPEKEHACHSEADLG